MCWELMPETRLSIPCKGFEVLLKTGRAVKNVGFELDVMVCSSATCRTLVSSSLCILLVVKCKINATIERYYYNYDSELQATRSGTIIKGTENTPTRRTTTASLSAL
jgi:hypothetical protein